MNAIEATGISKHYGKKEVLTAIDLIVPDGAIHALLGPNGAGKTSLVEILEGHRARTSGRLRVIGCDPGVAREFSVLRKNIGVVLQQTMLEPGISAVDLVRRQASYYLSPMDVDNLLERVGLAGAKATLVRALSGGMRRRLDIALALVGRPALLMLDEPSTGLDPVSRRSIRELIAEVNREGTSVVLTSHDLEEVQELASVVHILDGGRVVANGSPREIIRSSNAPTTVRFRRPALGGELLPDGAVIDDDIVTYRTSDGEMLVQSLNSWAHSSQNELADLSIVPPTLDDAYVTLIRAGERLRAS